MVIFRRYRSPPATNHDNTTTNNKKSTAKNRMKSLAIALHSNDNDDDNDVDDLGKDISFGGEDALTETSSLTDISSIISEYRRCVGRGLHHNHNNNNTRNRNHHDRPPLLQPQPSSVSTLTENSGSVSATREGQALTRPKSPSEETFLSTSTSKSVRFGDVQIREYVRIVGDNPSCSSGPPIGIGWDYLPASSQRVDAYERSRGARKQQLEMVLTRDDRERLLLQEWGATWHDVLDAIRANHRAKNQRRRTVNNLGKAEKIEEVMESVARKLKRTLLLNKSTTAKAKELEQQAVAAVVAAAKNAAATNHNHNKAAANGGAVALKRRNSFPPSALAGAAALDEKRNHSFHTSTTIAATITSSNNHKDDWDTISDWASTIMTDGDLEEGDDDDFEYSNDYEQYGRPDHGGIVEVEDPSSNSEDSLQELLESHDHCAPYRVANTVMPPYLSQPINSNNFNNNDFGPRVSYMSFPVVNNNDVNSYLRNFECYSNNNSNSYMVEPSSYNIYSGAGASGDGKVLSVSNHMIMPSSSYTTFYDGPRINAPAIQRHSMPVVITEDDGEGGMSNNYNDQALDHYFHFSYPGQATSTPSAATFTPPMASQESDFLIAPPPRSSTFVSSWS